MIEIGNALVIVAGTWILTFRLLIKPPESRSYAEMFLNMCNGLSLILAAPLLTFLDEEYRVPVVAVIGILLSTCHNFVALFVATFSLGAVLGAVVWQLGLCQAGADWNLHPLVLTLMVIISFVANACTPLAKAQSGTGTPFWVPVLGALMLTWGALNPQALWDVDCVADLGDINGIPLQFLGGWVCLTICGIVLQVVLMRRMKAAVQNGEDGTLADSLLPGKTAEGGGAGLKDGLNPKNASSTMEGYAKLRNAIFDETTDMSNFSDNEKQIVMVCRTDEFERDRLLWGGGLI